MVLWAQLLTISGQLARPLDLDPTWLVDTGWHLHEIVPEVSYIQYTAISILLQCLELSYVTFHNMHFTRQSLDGDKDEITRETHYCLLSVLHLLPFPPTLLFSSRAKCRECCPGPQEPPGLTARTSASAVSKPALSQIHASYSVGSARPSPFPWIHDRAVLNPYLTGLYWKSKGIAYSDPVEKYKAAYKSEVVVRPP